MTTHASVRGRRWGRLSLAGRRRGDERQEVYLPAGEALGAKETFLGGHAAHDDLPLGQVDRRVRDGQGGYAQEILAFVAPLEPEGAHRDRRLRGHDRRLLLSLGNLVSAGDVQGAACDVEENQVAVIRRVLLEKHGLDHHLAVHLERSERHGAVERDLLLRLGLQCHGVGALGVRTRAQLRDLDVDGRQRGLEGEAGEEVREDDGGPGDNDLVHVQDDGLAGRGRRLFGGFLGRCGLGEQGLQVGDSRLLAADRQLGRLQRHLGEMDLADEGFDRGESDTQLGNPHDRAALRVVHRHLAQADIPLYRQRLLGLALPDEHDGELGIESARRHAEGQQLRGNIRQIVGEVQVGHVDIEGRFQGVGERLGLALDRVPGPVHDRGEPGLDKGLDLGRDIRQERDADIDLANRMFLLGGLVAELRAAIDHLDIVDREAHRFRRLLRRRLRSRHEIREVVGLVRTADNADKRFRESDLLDDGGPPEQRGRFEVQVQLLEGGEYLRPLRLLDREPSECRRERERVDAHLRDGHLAMERRGELCGQDGLEDRGNDEKPDERKKDEKNPDADQDARAVTQNELSKANHVTPPVRGAYTTGSPEGRHGGPLAR